MEKKSKSFLFNDVGSLKEYFENILELVPGHLYWKDKNGIILGCNDAQAKVAGFKSRFEMIGKSDLEMPWKDQASSLRKADIEVMEKGVEITLEEESLLSSGTKAIFLSKKSPLYCNGVIMGVVGISTDITELKKTQQALLEQIKKTELAYRSKTEFLSMTTHEIRNPVGNVFMFNNFMKDELENLKAFMYQEIIPNLDTEKRESILARYNEIVKKMNKNTDIIEHESQKALEYLKNLGELHRLENEGVRVHFVKIKLKDLMEGVIKNTAHYNTKNVEILFEADPAISEIVIDYMNIYEALQVIVSNALRFSYPDSIIKINVTQKNDKLIFVVEDFGEGISVSQIQDLFQEIDPKKNKRQQTLLYRKPSLRLTQAKMKILASSSELQIERTRSGTRVTVLASVKNNPVKQHNSSILAAAYNQMPKHYEILVVEDDITFQQCERAILEELGHAVSIASTGCDALKMFEKNSYDIIFLDITLPDISGVEVIKKIRETNLESVIIVVTSHANQKDIEFFEESGATLVLTKPVSAEQFRECLEIDFEDDES